MSASRPIKDGKPSARSLPSARISNALAVTDGGMTVGFITAHGTKHLAYNIAGKLIGSYESQSRRCARFRGPRHDQGPASPMVRAAAAA
jgi:hypothetical protein